MLTDQLKKIVEDYNLTFKDVAYYLFVSEDTAKAYLASPSSKRHRKISEEKLKQLKDSVEKKQQLTRRLHNDFESLSCKLNELIESTFGCSRESSNNLMHVTKSKESDIKLAKPAYAIAKEFYQLADVLDDIYAGYCEVAIEVEHREFLDNQILIRAKNSS